MALIFYIYKAIIAFLLPPGLYITLIIAVIAVRVIQKRLWRKTDTALIVIAVFMYLTSISLVSTAMLYHIEHAFKPLPLKQTVAYKKIIILGAGVKEITTKQGEKKVVPEDIALPRLDAASKIYHFAQNKGQQDTVYISGGGYGKISKKYKQADVFKTALMELGVPEKQIFVENQSKTSKENVAFLEKRFGKDKLNDALLITSAFHLKRSYLFFQKAHISVKPYPVGFTTHKRKGLFSPYHLLPSVSAMHNMAIVVKEILGSVRARL